MSQLSWLADLVKRVNAPKWEYWIDDPGGALGQGCCDFIRDNAEAIEVGLRVLAIEQAANEDHPIALTMEKRWMTILHIEGREYPARGALMALRLLDRIHLSKGDA